MDLKSGYPFWAVKNGLLYTFPKLEADIECDVVARQRLDLPAVVELGLQLTSAVAALDAAGIIHRDLKPHNVLMHRVGRTVRPMLIDFGIATHREDGALAQVQKLTQTGMVLGTPHYLPPEQARCEPLDVRADLYALGILLYESLCGRTPFEDDNISSLMASVLRDERPRVTDFRPDCPEGFADILAKAIHRDREERFQTPAELIATLEAYAQSEGLVRGDAAFSGLCLSHEMTLPWALRSLAPCEKAATGGSSTAPLQPTESEPSWSPAGESSPLPAAGERGWRLLVSSVRKHVVSWTAIIGVVVGFGFAAFVGVEGGGVPRAVKAPVPADAPPRRATAMPVVLAHPPLAPLATALPGRDDAPSADEARDDVLAEPDEGESSSADRSPPPDALDSPTARTLERQAHRAYVRGRLADARALYERATQTDPSYGAAWRGYGLVAVQMGRKSEARHALRRYLVLEPGSSDADSIRQTLASL